MPEGMADIPGKTSRLTWMLALGGFIPFGTLAITVFVGIDPGLPVSTVDLFVMWSVIILSFLGGIRWGLALAETPVDLANLALSVLPCIIAWFSLLLPGAQSIAILMVLFLIHGWWDRKHLAQNAHKAWFANIRLVLTILVAGAHGLVLIRLW